VPERVVINMGLFQSRPDPSKSIIFRQSHGEVLLLEVPLTATVERVKEMIRQSYPKRKLVHLNLTIRLGGRVLDDTQTLAHYAIELGSTLDLEVIESYMKC
jgi:hypothetical protein